jgi:LysM repeat protein
MGNFKLFYFSILCFVSLNLCAQPAEYRMSRQEYIEKFKEEAIKEMLEYGIPASITLSQGMLESGDGNSPLAKYANNHFGIKCHKGWDGPTFIQDDDTKNECFRKYYSPYESYRDHSIFLKTRSRYRALFDLPLTDYKAWAHGLKAAGYATNPKYADLLVRIIEDHKLYELDRIGKMPAITPKTTVVKAPVPESLSALNVAVRNNIKYVVARPGDTPYKLARELDMATWQIYKYNDLSKNDQLKSGEIIYLQPKRNKAEEEFHVVQHGETLRSISQKHGVKIIKIISRNNLAPGVEPSVGEKLYLRKRAGNR